MKSARLILLSALVLAAGGILGIALIDWLEDSPTTQFLPLQMLPSDYSRAEAIFWRQRLLDSHEARLNRVGEESPSHIEDANQILTELAIQHPAALADPDLSATATALIHHYAENAATPRAKESVARLCLLFRWTPARLQPITGTCHDLVQEHGILSTEVVTQSGPDGLLLIAVGSDLNEALRIYMENPYKPHSVYALSFELDPDKRGPIVQRLYVELLQLDATRAATLQSQIARSSGLTHSAHDISEATRIQ